MILFHTKGTSSRVIGPKTNSSPLENMPDAPEVHLLIFYNFRGEYLTLLRTNSSPLPQTMKMDFHFHFLHGGICDRENYPRVVFRGGMFSCCTHPPSDPARDLHPCGGMEYFFWPI